MKTEQLKAICGGISEARAQELLEAASGSLERAIEIFFEHQSLEEHTLDQDVSPGQVTSLQNVPAGAASAKPACTNTSTNKRSKPSSPPKDKPKKAGSPSPRFAKQARLDGFLLGGHSPGSNSPHSKKQTRLDAFFGLTKGEQKPGSKMSLSKHPGAEDKDAGIGGRDLNDVDAKVIDEVGSTSVPLMNENPKAKKMIPPAAGGKGDAAPKMDTNEPKQGTVPRSSEASKPATDPDPRLGWSQISSFAKLADSLQELSETTKRLVKLDILENFIRDILVAEPPPPIKPLESGGDIETTINTKIHVLTCALHLILGFRRNEQAAPLEVSGAAVSKALQTVLGVTRMQLSRAYRQSGDLGDGAAQYYQSKPSYFLKKPSNKSGWSIVRVMKTLEQIASTNKRDAKETILVSLLRSCQSKRELRFLVRLLIGNMRIGASLKTVLAALGRAVVPKNGDCEGEIERKQAVKEATDLVQKTHDVCPSLERIIRALLVGGLDRLSEDCGIEVMTPIAPMLANPVHSLEEVRKEMENTSRSGDSEDKEVSNSMIMEFKYDGVRCQAHYDGSSVKLFSRHLLETTEQYPDVARSLLDSIRTDKDDDTAGTSQVDSFIIDAEIVGVENMGNGEIRLLPFQDLSRRKKVASGMAALANGCSDQVQVKLFAFDLMYLNGSSFIQRPLWQRQEALRKHFRETDGFCFVKSRYLMEYNERQLRGFLQESMKIGAEGLMLKMLGSGGSLPSPGASTILEERQVDSESTIVGGSPYEAGTRSKSWLKVKRDYVAGYADTIDVVPIGAWYGNGRKAQKSFLSPVLLAVYDEDDDVYRSISRCMTFTDSMYQAMREFYFLGKPYPKHVGVEAANLGGEQSKYPESNLDTVREETKDEDVDIHSDTEMDEPSKNSNDFFGDGEEMANCFPGRPSSTCVITNESPPIWFKPLEVFEVSFADMSLSRQHSAAAGLVDDPEGRGVALRFPRFKRRRPDKTPEQATTVTQIAQLFAKQSKQGVRHS